MNILFLYAEVMPYTVEVLKSLTDKDKNIHITVYCWGIKRKLTKYAAPHLERVEFLNEENFTYQEVVKHILALNPRLIYVSGRQTRKYLTVVTALKKKGITAPVISGMDNQFRFSMKEIIKILTSRWLYRKYFDYIWVPGPRQYTLAMLLGYGPDKIVLDLYSSSPVRQTINIEDKIYKDIVYVGRLEPDKGIYNICIELQKMKNKGLFNERLIIFGDGSLRDELKAFEFCDFKGFSSWEEINAVLSCVRFSVVPSNFEPWGLVIHEFALAGVPILCSYACGAADYFVRNGVNGYLFNPSKKNDITEKLANMLKLSDADLKKMRYNSGELGYRLLPSHSANSLMHVISR